ncbi:MAG: phosphatidylserine decarboxylase [Verrucomicrobiales bacterium]|nr:phosphatidylserine decarboxylase [Verrucomicrobiales bacterium]
MSANSQAAPSAGSDTSVNQKHRGRSIVEGLKIISLSGIILGTIGVALIVGFSAPPSGSILMMMMVGVWAFWSCLVIFFFRDTDPHPPFEPGVIVSPAHGTVDYVDETEEKHFMEGRAHRVSIYLSLRDVHVQNAPIAGKVEFLKHFPGRFARAIRRDASLRNDHLLIGFAFAPHRKMAIRLTAGVVVRRVLPWIEQGQFVARGERISLICFGSRVDVFLPSSAEVVVNPGDKLRGGETIIARLPEEVRSDFSVRPGR